MYKIAMFLVLAFGFLVPSCSPEEAKGVIGSGSMASETRLLGDFHGIDLGIPGEMKVTLGDAQSISIEAEDNILPLIETRVSGGKLTVGSVPGKVIQPTKPIKYVVTTKTMDQLITGSLGSIIAPALSVKKFKAEINSTGAIEIETLEADSLEVAINSVGNVKIRGGEVQQQSINISSTGNYQAPDLKSATAKVTIDSSGDAILWVSDRLDVVINSSGSVRYYGDPNVKSEVNSSGSIQPLGQK
jgi:hypothetical protein